MKQRKSRAGLTWLFVIGGIAALSAFITCATEGEFSPGWIAVLVIGIFLIILGFILLAAINSENDQSYRDNQKYKFQVKCPHCQTVFKYDYNEVRLHRNWPNGYIDCPLCHKHIGHMDENRIIDEKHQ